ncbi:MAG TPA: hypothetical protein VMA36_13310 [Candidatus Limnocylindria bacterium]|jgi:hypothetical protein|nr:hypothetical protein [Candidatus Limnocylindria bacterium]
MWHRNGAMGAVTALALVAVLVSTPAPAFAGLEVPTVDLQFILTHAAGGDETSQPGNSRIDGNVRVQGSVTEAVGNNVSFSYDHFTGGALETTIGRAIAPDGTPIINGSIHDIVDDFRVDATMHQAYAEAGYFYRQRACCPGMTDPTNLAPADWHETYLTLGYDTIPVAALHGTVFNYSITGHLVPHHVTEAYLAGLPAGFTDNNHVETGISQSAGLMTPVDVRHKLFVGGSYGWGAMDYFDNAPFPFYYVNVNLVARKVVNKYLSFTGVLNNLAQRNQGYPFASPQGIHRVFYTLTADVKIGH